jgi:DnaJ-class molecular chaperone
MSSGDLNMTAEPCRWCGGTGRNNALHHRHPPGACRACAGAGSILVYLPARPCPQCGGTGVSNTPAPGLGSVPCHDCSGTGWLFFILRFDGDGV